SRLHQRDVGRGASGRLDHKAGGHEIETASPVFLTEVDAEKAGSRQVLPQGAVDRTFFARRQLDLLEALGGGSLREDPTSQLADGILRFAVIEVHVRVLFLLT